MDATTIGVIVAASAVLVREIRATTLDRRRGQPVVIGHGRNQSASTGPFVLMGLASDGLGPAFNVRFGVKIDGVRLAFRETGNDDYRPDRITVMRSEQTLPLDLSDRSDGVLIKIPPKAQLSPALADRSYWCRYENAIGETWETINPPNPSENVKIVRVRFAKWRERREIDELTRWLDDA